MKKNYFSPSYLIILIALTHLSNFYAKPPRLTIIFIIDQLPHQLLVNLYPHLRGGLKFFMDNGINYENAIVPHARPATATGHAGLSTGTYPKDHGIIDNAWFDTKTETMIKADDDTAVNAAVFSPTGTYDYGKSAQYIMVDSISDQFVLQSQPDTPRHAISISLKSRSAIATANKLGKAIWFDGKTGFFTSSKAYFKELPAWVQTFNQQKKVNQLTHVQWKLAYPLSNPAYRFSHIIDYTYVNTQHAARLAGHRLPIEKQKNNPYHFFEKTPQANQLVLDLAQECVATFMQEPHSQFLLWVCLSSLDLVGHSYGPGRLEPIDMLYHLDRQIKNFMNNIKKLVPQQETLFALTSDHGSSPLIELVHHQGINFAQRIDQQEFINRINTYIKNKYNLTNVAKALQLPSLYLDQTILNSLSPAIQKQLTKDLKNFLHHQTGVKQVWTFDELHHSCFAAEQIEDYFKKQLFLGRSGSIIMQIYPYVYLTPYPNGADHLSPYNYDTHIPLILYQQGTFEQKKIIEKVWSLQLANTLAQILTIPKPSASTFNVLPKLFE